MRDKGGGSGNKNRLDQRIGTPAKAGLLFSGCWFGRLFLGIPGLCAGCSGSWSLLVVVVVVVG